MSSGVCLSCGLHSDRFNPSSGACVHCCSGKLQLAEVCTSCEPRIQRACIKCREDIEIQDENMECLNCRLSANWQPTQETRVRMRPCLSCGVKSILDSNYTCVRCHVKDELFKQGMAKEIFECTNCTQHTRNEDMCDTCMRTMKKCQMQGCSERFVPKTFDDKFCSKHKTMCKGCLHRIILDNSKGLCEICTEQQAFDNCTYCGKSTIDQFSDHLGHCFDCANSFKKQSSNEQRSHTSGSSESMGRSRV